MNRETKTCQNCQSAFIIEPEDFEFYEKIKVPPPTFCPDCRLQRRLAFYNVFSLYKRNCDLCGRNVISRYSPESSYRVYCPRCWWSDKWDPLEYGRDYDFSRPFFEQFQELWRETPILGLSLDLQSAEESPHNNDAGHLKKCHLLFSADYNEYCAYGYYLARSKDCFDIYFSQACELSFNLFHCFRTSRVIGSCYTRLCNDSVFLWQSTNCQDCFASANLRNKKYYIFNQPYSKEEYFKKIKEFDLGSYSDYSVLKDEAQRHWLKYPVKTSWDEFSNNVSGLFVFESRNCQSCFEVVGAEDCKFVSFIQTPTIKSSYDYTYWGDKTELVYESVISGLNVRNLKFGDETGMGLYDVSYSKLNIGSSYLFGCVSLRQKQYCILNKQYRQSEYEKIIPKIINHMNEMPYTDKNGRIYKYGEFFPIEISPFAYNDTLAQDYYPLTKEEALENGYRWEDKKQSEYAITLKAKDLPDHIKDTQDSVLEEVIGCISCGRGYKLISSELAFYRRLNLPLPRKCFFCRLKDKLNEQPHPMRFWQRRCQCAGGRSDNGIYQNVTAHPHHSQEHCPNEFQTTYALERPEIVYCKQCYNAEVV